jgi:hypothetical protein
MVCTNGAGACGIGVGIGGPTCLMTFTPRMMRLNTPAMIRLPVSLSSYTWSARISDCKTGFGISK